MQIGIQLYTLREAAERNFIETLKIVSEQGYEGVELAGTYGYEAEELKKIFDEYHVIPVSAHVSLEELIQDREGVFAFYKKLGCKTIVLPYLSEEKRYGSVQYENILSQMKEIGKECAKAGFDFAYHNHDFEFAKTKSGGYVLDDMFAQISPEYLQAELDTCWIAVAGESAESYIRHYQNRCRIIHIKDFKREQEVILTPLGKGEMDLQNVCRMAEECDIKWLIVEQDEHYGENPFVNTEISIQYLKSKINGGN